MSKKEIMEVLQLNGKDKKNKIVLILLASLLAMAAAVFGILRVKKSDKADVKKAVKMKRQPKARAISAEKTSASKKSSEAAVQQTTVQPQPVYIVHPLPEKKQESKGRKFKRHMSAAVAAILVISLVASGPMSYVTPATVLAKGSFSGIGRIVEDHISSGSPYVILDIVPTVAKSGDYTFSTGTMGYLVSGQAPIVRDLQGYLVGNLEFFDYTKRKNDFLDKVITSGFTGSGFPDVTYRESYGGVGGLYDVNASSGWIKMFDAVTEPVDGAPVPTGVFKGKVEYSPKGTAAEGYVFQLVELRRDDWKSAKTSLDGYYKLNSESGSLRVLFTPSVDGNYVVASASDDLSEYAAYAPNTWVYKYDPETNTYVLQEYTLAGLMELARNASSKGKGKEHVKSDNWDRSEESHWHICSVEGCDEKFDEGFHEYIFENGTLCICGKLNPNSTPTVGKPEVHDHVGDWVWDGSIHWRACTVEGCDVIEESADHVYTDGVCELCGASDPTTSGVPGSGNNDESKDHEHQANSWMNDGDSHCQICEDDGEVFNRGSHDFSSGNCVCGASAPTTGETTTPIPGDNQGEGNGDGETSDKESLLEDSTPVTTSTPTEMDGDGISAKSMPVPGGWLKLVGLEGELQNEGNPTGDGESGSTGSDENNSDSDSESIDWEWLKEQGYCVVTFRALTEEDTITDETVLYDASVGETLSSADGVVDAYDFVERVDEVAKISLFSFQTPVFGTDTDDVAGIFKYDPNNDGTYGGWKIERVADGSEDPDAGIIEVKNAPVYFRCSSSNDWLKEYVFGTLSGGDNDNNDFNIEVYTVPANEVTRDMISNADLIYLESGQGNTVLSENLTTDYIIGADAEADISEDAVKLILMRAVDDLMPIIVDYDIKNDVHYTDSNYQYLARTLMKRDLAEFYLAVDDPSNFMYNIVMGINDEDKYPTKNDNDFHYVNQNVYVIGKDVVLVNEDFPTELEEFNANAGFSDVLAAIRAENTMLSDEDKMSVAVSKARAVQYIINFSVGIIGEFGDLRILELQPTANLTSDLSTGSDSKGNTRLLWKSESVESAQQIILTSKNEFAIKTDTKSVAEFNGEWEDINGNYDIVFIGLDGQRLNRGDDGETRYNSDWLNGKVYHKGDDSGLGKYDDNDITAQKMTDLLEYMAAGYPVVVENDFFKGRSAQNAEGEQDINTKYVGDDTVMYKFLRAAITEEYKDMIYTVSDAVRGPMFMTQVKIAKPRINLTSAEGSDASKVTYLTQDENGEYHGQIAYEITDNRGEAYFGESMIRVYADYNYDGIFGLDEEVTSYINENVNGVNVVDVAISGMGPGILPWKVEVSVPGNPNRRDSIEGYFEIGSYTHGELKVLQITEGTLNADVNLQTMFYQSENSMLAYWLKNAQDIIDSDMQIETTAPTDLESKLSENSKYLEQWDVVVLTLDGGALPGGVSEAIDKYVSDGRSLLVCGGTDAVSDRKGLSAELLGQTNDKTFVWLGANGASAATYQRYAGLNDSMYGAMRSLQAQPVNEGSISHYPYTIADGGITVGVDVDVKASEYLLDFRDNIKSESYVTYVTPWYTLGGGIDTAYGISPKDARNNYYCYSKGNVVYLAQSSYPYSYEGDITAIGADECKFFVNALMAAYSAGVHGANVHIVAGFTPDSADVESIAVPFDRDWLQAVDEDGSRGMLDDTVDVYFRFRDNNFAKDKKVEIAFLREDPSGPYVPIGGREVQAVSFNSDIWTVTNGKLTYVGNLTDGVLTLAEGAELVPGQVYRIKAPVVTLEDNSGENKADIYIVIRTTFTRGGRPYEIISSDVVSLNRAQLFLLE